MEYKNFVVVGEPHPYDEDTVEFEGVITIKCSRSRAELKEVLEGHSGGVPIHAIQSKCGKPDRYSFRPEADSFSDQAIQDFLRDLDLLLEVKNRAEKNAARRRTTGGRRFAGRKPDKYNNTSPLSRR